MSILSALLHAGTQSEDAVRPPVDDARKIARKADDRAPL